MNLIRKIFIGLGLIVFIAFVILIYKEYFIKKPEKTIFLEEPESTIKEEESIKESRDLPSLTSTLENIISTTSLTETTKKPILLFDFPLISPNINYPEVYAYDPQSKTVRTYNIEDKSYKELYKDENIIYALFPSNNNDRFFIKSKNVFYLIDRLKDKKYSLNYLTQKVFFYQNTPYLFISGLTTNGYLAKFQDNETRFMDIFILNPDIDFLTNGILIAENLKYSPASPLYLKKMNKSIELIFPPKRYLSFITNKNDLVFASFIENSWKSLLIDGRNNVISKEFTFGTIKEKCTFEELLICGVPKDQGFNKIENWYYLKSSFNDNLIIYDPQKDFFQVVKIDGDFDIIQPKLTPLGIIFYNRNDAKLYFINKDNLSL
ncbi:MAG: hypothetical protein KatS3mg094_319 [Candidatus Parcubacteria bacterium]|nr:MAG: hypothetical protein KatS3mg094_319 [Candidatus Parcubacteria bacterium]